MARQHAAAVEPWRVLLVVDSLDGGGGERHVIGLARELDRRGHEVTLACSTLGVLAGALHGTGVAVRPLLPGLVKRRLCADYARRLRDLVCEGSALGDFDVVHAHMYASAAAAAAAASRPGVPLVVTEHTEAPWRGAQARLVSRRTFRRAERIVAVSSAIRDLLIDDYAVPRDRVRVVVPALPDLPRRDPAGTPAAPRRAGLAAAPRIGFVGRLAPEKGVDVLLAALARLRTRHPGVRLVVAGGGPAGPALAALAGELGVAAGTDFLGYLPDPWPALAGLDALVVPSRSDGTPIVALEAQAAGVPVVASAVGGLPDRIRPGVDGLLVPPGDPGALAGALDRLLGDPTLRARLTAAGRLRAAACTHERMVDELLGVYADAAGARRPVEVALPAAPPADLGASLPAARRAAALTVARPTAVQNLQRTGLV